LIVPSIRRLHLFSLSFAAVVFLATGCSEDCTTCPPDDPGGAAATGWFVQATPTDVILHGVEVLDANTVVAVGYSGVILRTTDGGKDWQIIESGTTEDLRAIDFADERTGWAVGHNGVILKTVDAGVSWATQTPNVISHYRGVFFLDDQTGWATGSVWPDPDIQGYVIKTTDGGDSWVTQLNGPSNAVCFVDADTGCVAWSGGVNRTTDGGTT